MNEQKTVQLTPPAESPGKGEDRSSSPAGQRSIGGALGTLATMGVFDVVAHTGLTGLVIGGIASYVVWRHGPEVSTMLQREVGIPRIPLLSGTSPKKQQEVSPTPAARQVQPPYQERKFWQKALGIQPKQETLTPVPSIDEEPVQEFEQPHAVEAPRGTTVLGDEVQLDTEGEDIFLDDTMLDDSTLPRITVEEAVDHIPRNSYKVYVGRSLIKPKNPAISINFHREHMKVIGASQKGKTSIAAAIMAQILKTHDNRHVQLAILDLENMTGRLFEDDPHIAKIRLASGNIISLHARSKPQVLEYLGHLDDLLEYRYQVAERSLQEIERLPIVLVYLEEFVILKNYFKNRMANAKGDSREQAIADYNNFIYRVTNLASRGLKVKIQLLMVAQVQYREEDLVEAFANVTSGLSLCVLPTAAKAAGFYDYKSITKNAYRNKKGEAVLQTPNNNDTILTIDFPLREKLLALGNRETPHEIPLIDLSQSQGYPTTPPMPQKQEPVKEEDDLMEQALRAWDEGYRTIDALAAALEISPWNARPIYARVKLQRPTERQEVSS